MLRLLALLIALGLCAGVALAGEPSTDASGAVAPAWFVIEAEDPVEADLIATPIVVEDLDRTIDASARIMHPPRYQHLMFVFRPPRAPAFD